MDIESKQPVLGYLSAAPRVSTRASAEHGGARSHTLGVMRAFESLNWDVKPFIVGDRVPQSWNKQGSENVIRGGGLKTLLVDLVRISMGIVNACLAWRELGCQVDWVYERAASLQSLGGIFKRHGIPWILETNAPLFYEAKHERKTVVFSSLARFLEINAYKNCDVLVCITEALKDIMIREAGILSEKVIVMPNGVDVDFFNPAIYQPRMLFGNSFTIGFVGKLFGWQGVDVLLEVLSDLKEDGLTLNLVILGDGVARAELERKTQALGLTAQVQFVGRVPGDEVPAYIAGFDIGYSGQIQLPIGVMYRSPLKLYEYMAMAKPVIASRFADAQKVIKDEETGYLFDPGDKASLKDKLILAYQNKLNLIYMGQKARDEIVQNHSWISRVTELVEKVERVLTP